MHVSRKADYAVRSLAYLAGRPDSGLVLISEIAEAMVVPRAFLSKIMREMVDAGLVLSQPGRKGGYRLARESSEITFRHIIEAVEGPIHMVPCQEDGADDCLMSSSCTQVPIWDRIRSSMLDVFSEYTLDQVKSPAMRPNVELIQVGR
ncbi:MAG: Rrf2 family transcriptional regulator [Deltaproteobacteria bacterium]|nr:Rrf2 family transcriptional regulator [Deltaproteobacteria bacterium]